MLALVDLDLDELGDALESLQLVLLPWLQERDPFSLNEEEGEREYVKLALDVVSQHNPSLNEAAQAYYVYQLVPLLEMLAKSPDLSNIVKMMFRERELNFVQSGTDIEFTIAQRARELSELSLANSRVQLLQQIDPTLSSTPSLERIVVQSLHICSLALGEMGIPYEAIVGAGFLYDKGMLRPIAHRRFSGNDSQRVIAGKEGVVGAALAQGEPVVTNNPQEDPELQVYEILRECLTAICVPLRAGFQLFGAMVIGTVTAVHFDLNHIDLFKAVGDQAVIALQNAQLYQRLEAEKQWLIEADEKARKELARDLHDGPTQSIAAIAMRMGFARTMIDQDPARAKEELLKVEALAKRTSAEIRGILFTLRPLVLETQGLGAAVDALLRRYSESDGIEMHLIGAENSKLLNKMAQGVAFAILEEALNNARKYARATLIEVRFWQDDGLFVASVRDDGVGFDMHNINRAYSTRRSLEMVNMREHAQRIDGALRIESSPDSGTTVMLVVPLNKHGAEMDEEESPTAESQPIKSVI